MIKLGSLILQVELSWIRKKHNISVPKPEIYQNLDTTTVNENIMSDEIPQINTSHISIKQILQNLAYEYYR